MKKIDKLLLTSFFGPFLVSFGIALFVLIMQFLWLYIDEIAGKGVSIFILMELIAYLSISIFPTALPIAVLIASVMVMGNLAERYELSSMKSAGVSLLRIMRGLMICAAGISIFSYVCSDFLMPIANLKFKSRLYDIRKQKPALTIEKGVFNEDFRQFVIRVGEKERDGETIGNVLIEDQTNAGRIKFNQILADSGQMFTTADKRYFVMNLFQGTQYQEPGSQGAANGQQQKYPFIRTNFRSWSKVWDLREFEMNRTDEDRFKAQRSMLSMGQLRSSMDSLQRMMYESRQSMASDMLLLLQKQPLKPADTTAQAKPSARDSLRAGKKPLRGERVAQALPDDVQERVRRLREQKNDPALQGALPPNSIGVRLPRQVLAKPLSEHASLEETFAADDRESLRKEALVVARRTTTQVETRNAQVASRNKEYVKTGYELYTKYSFALVCFIFLFIGAPMGAIIRKGGFGYPILVSIIFFVLFVMLAIVCKKLAELYILTPFWAAMVPCIVLTPIGVYLTRQAMKDAQMFSTDRLDRWLAAMRKKLEKRREPLPAP
ncbi:MAG TPA: LptF/LptG family permease [Saprospiraceae bacterium]|nr:LptF/LptG family permease [Saprospiraceae bacterium]